MSDEAAAPRRKRRSTGARGKLRKGHNVESVIEETFSLFLPASAPETLRKELATKQNTNHAGDGCYISATVHTSRYYGVLVEQSALKAASILHFQNEASSLDLNRRMKMLQESQANSNEDDTQVEPSEGNDEDYRFPVEEEDTQAKSAIDTAEDRKRPAKTAGDEPSLKRVKVTDAPTEKARETVLQTIQKFRYVDGEGYLPGYRILLATYANVQAASEDDAEKEQQIEKACQEGGGFVGSYYYQYENVSNVLETSKLTKPSDIGMRMSLGFEQFIQQTGLPTWFPLSNLQTGQAKVLSMLNLKKEKGGDSVVWDGSAETLEIESAGTFIPMEPRSRYRVGVLGAGIAGLACATELLQQAERENIDLDVVVLEGRSRVGGRLLTDESSFKCVDGITPFPVDLGASWIHGIDHNPLAALAKEAGVSFVTSSEEVKMLTENLGSVDSVIDERIGELFDDLLDQAADNCWEQDEFVSDEQRSQKAVRWYASVLGNGPAHDKAAAPLATDAPPHRSSSDVSIDYAIGRVIALKNQKKFARMSTIEQNLLLWNVLNINYALGANISDLSMKYFDSDGHEFDGDHVLLKEGYSQIVRHMLHGLKAKGDRFQLVLDCPVEKVEYARKSTTMPYPGNDSHGRKMVDMSDTCCVTSRDEGKSFKFDFLVSTLPLGVLKESVRLGTASDSKGVVSFQPPLPFPKRDAIQNVGFGLLNKVYLQFPTAFWRVSAVLPNGQVLFGNASGVNPEHYMFYDMGKSLGSEYNSPAILMTLISGKEAVASERLSDEDLVKQVLRTLRVLFSEESVPEPVATKTTRWGTDEFSRGCYTFLPPGTTDQDFQILQSPINGNGDSLVLDGSETMRLFWAGEHTTSLHPSLAHGAMLSGIRAAKDVIATLQFRHLEGRTAIDKLIPLPIFRERNPNMPLQCSLCGLFGSTAREGSLLAFQRGSRQVLAHNNCAEHSPEVEVEDGIWKNVIKAVNRGKQIECSLCGQSGATVGCTHPNCFKSYHSSCGEETGWRFERDGKVFYCDMHRSKHTRDIGPSECDKVSLRFFRSRYPSASLICSLCGIEGDDKRAGNILIFQQRNQHILVHENCAQFTTVVETLEENDDDVKFRNLLEAVSSSKHCARCKTQGATIACSEPTCATLFHFLCAEESGWNMDKDKKQFQCENHRGDGHRDAKPKTATSADSIVVPAVASDAFGGRGANLPTASPKHNTPLVMLSAVANVNDGRPTFSNGTTTLDADATNSGTPSPALTTNVPGAPNGVTAPSSAATSDVSVPESAPADSSIFQHNLFCVGGTTVVNGNAKTSSSQSQPSNADINGLVIPPKESKLDAGIATKGDGRGVSEDDGPSSDEESEVDVFLQPLAGDVRSSIDRETVAVTVRRASVFDPWNFSFALSEDSLLCIEVNKDGPEGLENGDTVMSINCIKLGSAGAANLQEILSLMRDATSLEIKVNRAKTKEAPQPDMRQED